MTVSCSYFSSFTQNIKRPLRLGSETRVVYMTIVSDDPACVLLYHYGAPNVLWMRYEVVPKGLLTLLGSLNKEVAKTTSGTLVYRFERQTARKKVFLLSKNTVSST